MEAAWKSMEKKEKIPWIKKAAEDQKRYEVQYQPVVSEPRPLTHTDFTHHLLRLLYYFFLYVNSFKCSNIFDPVRTVLLSALCVVLTAGVLQRELLEMRTPAAGQSHRKPKFDGEPKKPPV